MKYKVTEADAEKAFGVYQRSDHDGLIAMMQEGLQACVDSIPEPAAASPPIRTMIRVQASVFAIEDIRSWHRNSKGELVVIHCSSGASEKYAVSASGDAEDLEAFLRTYYPIAREFSKKGDA